MKNFLRLTTTLILLMFLGGNAWGQETILSEALRDGALPTSWSQTDVTFSTSAGGYANFTKTTAILTTPVIDLSGYTSVNLTFEVAKYGGGNDGSITVIISDDGGSTWTAQTFDSPIPTGSSYLTSGPTTITATGSNVVIRFTRTGSYSGKRLRDVVLEGTPSAGGNDTDSKVYSGTQPATSTISSLVDTDGEALNVFSMVIEDQGTSDGLATKVTNIRVTPHTSNNADWTDNILGVKLYSGGTVTIGSPTITDTHIDIPITSGNLDVIDGGTRNVVLAIYLNTSNIADGKILSFMVDADNHGFTADASGSSFASTFPGGDFNSNDFTIDVDATQFTYLQQPSNVTVDEIMSPSVQVAFTDANGNTDVDENGVGSTITLTTTGTFSGSATTAVDATSGIATFDNLVFSADAIGRTITATDTDGGDISPLQSGTFDVAAASSGGGMEDFTNSNAGSSYSTSSFVGNDGITWSYVESRDENGDANNSGIDGNALMLRRLSDKSSVTSSAISGGIGNFSVKLYKGFTGGGNRQVELFINGVSKGTSATFDDFNEHVFTVNNINIAGDIVIQIKNITSNQVIVDDITWTGFSAGPTSPSLTTEAVSSILTTTATGNGTITATGGVDATTRGFCWDIATNPDPDISDSKVEESGTFSTGTFTGNIAGLSAGTEYKVRAFATNSAKGTGYGDVVTFTTHAGEPSNHPTNIQATVNSSTQITINWTDATTGAQLPEGYLVKAAIDPVTPTAPVDGTPEADALLVKNIAQGIGEAVFTGLTANTTYNFTIWPYTNSGANIDYKTDGTPLMTSATTNIEPGGIENPYTCAEIIALNNPGTTDKWVKGYIVGYFSGSTTVDQTAPFGGNTNIGLADDQNETSYSNMVVVQLLDNAAGLRNIIGLQSNENNFGVMIQVRGDLVEYFSTTGLKNTDDYKWVNSPTVTGDGNWSDNSTWGHGIPGKNDDVVVSSGLLTLDASGSCNTISILDGAKVTINPSQTLSVSGIITIEDGGSFINNGTLDNGAKADASATMQRAIDGYTLSTNGWHLLGSPVGTFNINGSEFDPGTVSPNLDDFYGWAEDTYTWMNHKQGDPSQMIPGTGYLVAYETTATKNFTGTFNNANITHNNLSLTTGKGEGWHLLGNPFQSALQWTNTDWAKSNMGPGAKIMNSGGNYTDLTVGGTDIIPANQGFLVEATVDANNSITIPASQRVHDGQAFYKSDPVDMLTLRASDGDFYVETWVQIMDDATAAYDVQYDVHFFGGMYNAPYLYSKISDSERLSTNRIAPVEESTTIQLAFKSFLNKEFTITASGLNSFSTSMDIILEDTQEDVQIDLRETAEYTFMANADELTERFKLHLLKTTSIHEANQIEGLNIYAHANTLYLNSDKARDAQVEMYNVTGQLTFSQNVPLDGLTQITPQLPTGWYVVKVSTTEGMATEKVFIK